MQVEAAGGSLTLLSDRLQGFRKNAQFLSAPELLRELDELCELLALCDPAEACVTAAAAGTSPSSWTVLLLRRLSNADGIELSEELMDRVAIFIAALSGNGEHTLQVRVGPAASLQLRCTPRSSGTGTRLWRSSRLAIEALQQGSHGISVVGARVIELGCGVAAAGLACASLGAAQVTLTDNDETVLALARKNVRLNGLERVAQVAKVDLNSAPIDFPHYYDLVIASDLCYDFVPPANIVRSIAHYLRCSADNPHARALVVHDMDSTRSATAHESVLIFSNIIAEDPMLRLIARKIHGDLIIEVLAIDNTFDLHEHDSA
eukprot:scaffold55293_cov32-Tisochrysis_lutea.AAC.1